MDRVIPGIVLALTGTIACTEPAIAAAAAKRGQQAAANHPQAIIGPSGPAIDATKASPHKPKPRVRYSVPARKKD